MSISSNKQRNDRTTRVSTGNKLEVSVVDEGRGNLLVCSKSVESLETKIKFIQ